MKIGIVGIYGVYNFGCEAIVRGCVEYFKSVYDDAIFTYYSFRADEDAKTLENLRINVVQIGSRKNYLDRAINRIASSTKIMKRSKIDFFDSIIEQSDVVISVGGDLYTIPKFGIDNPKFDYYNQLIQFGEKVIKAKKQFVIYGASIGPFGNNKKIKKYFFDHLKKVTLILCREKITLDYLIENGIVSNVKFVPDPAYILRDGNRAEISSGKIGVNFSGLSNYEVNGKINIDFNKFANALIWIIDNTGKDLLLIPHVLSPVLEKDNDFYFLSNVKHLLPITYQERVEISMANCFFEAKQELKKCEVVLAARMHCAINAVSEGIPTIFISYSSKAIGMAEYVYNSTEYSVSINDFDKWIVKRLHTIIEQKDEISKKLNIRMMEIQQEIKQSIPEVKGILNKKLV